jgi:hypothetical protein
VECDRDLAVIVGVAIVGELDADGDHGAHADIVANAGLYMEGQLG